MTGCRFSTGSCITREGAVFIWKPLSNQACRFVVSDNFKGSSTLWCIDTIEQGSITVWHSEEGTVSAGFTVAISSVCALIGVSKLNPPDHALGLGGNEVTMAGSATVRFDIGANTFFQTTHFTKGQCIPEGGHNYDFIIGNDLLQRLSPFRLDYTNGCFEIGDVRLPLGEREEQTVFPSRYAVHIFQDTVVPPMSEIFVKCVAPIVWQRLSGLSTISY
ncbi:unnamed protein product [Caenorhabditis nigoni]